MSTGKRDKQAKDRTNGVRGAQFTSTLVDEARNITEILAAQISGSRRLEPMTPARQAAEYEQSQRLVEWLANPAPITIQFNGVEILAWKMPNPSNPVSMTFSLDDATEKTGVLPGNKEESDA